MQRMYFANIKLVFILLVATTSVDGIWRGGSTRISRNGKYKPILRSSYSQLADLKSQMYLCTGKFFCGVRTVNNVCQLDCIDFANVCDGTMNCINGWDEMNCPVQTPCPEKECPELATPCPECACPEPETAAPCPVVTCPPEVTTQRTTTTT